MKAIRMHRFGGPDVLRYEEVDTPVPSAEHVLIAVTTAGVTYGDIMRRSGIFGGETPCGIGMEVVGTIAEKGASVHGLDVGSRVAAWVDAGYAEYALADRRAVVPLPDDIDDTQAIVLPVHGMTAYQALTMAGRIQQGDTVLVHAAAGGVGTLAIQLARLLGAGTVVGTASRPEKLAHIRGLGADFAVDYSDESWQADVRDAVGGSGVDLVLDSIGGEITTRSSELLAPFGRLVTLGLASGQEAGLSPMALMNDNLSVVGYSLSGALDRPGRTTAEIGTLLDHVAAGRLRATISGRYPLADAAVAHQDIEQRRTTGKTVLTP